MSQHYHHHQHSAAILTARNGLYCPADSKDLTAFAAHSNRLLLDIHGQPIVTRSKSMSTGSSLQQQQTDLVVMVPASQPAKTLESAVKSYVRSLRERVHKQPPATAANPTLSAGVDNVGYECGGHRRRRIHHHRQSDQQQQQQQTPLRTALAEPSSGATSRNNQLANLPVVSCASASAPRQPDQTWDSRKGEKRKESKSKHFDRNGAHTVRASERVCVW